MFNLENVIISNIAVLISNGDGRAFHFHLESVTVSSNNWYVVFKDMPKKTNMNCRVQYVIFY